MFGLLAVAVIAIVILSVGLVRAVWNLVPRGKREEWSETDQAQFDELVDARRRGEA